MIIDENKIKEYVNYHDWVYCPNEWHELWNTSASVRGILPLIPQHYNLTLFISS